MKHADFDFLFMILPPNNTAALWAWTNWSMQIKQLYVRMLPTVTAPDQHDNTTAEEESEFILQGENWRIQLH